jgi:hypothetical protein
MARAAGGTSQREKPGPAIWLPRSKNDAMALLHLKRGLGIGPPLCEVNRISIKFPRQSHSIMEFRGDCWKLKQGETKPPSIIVIPAKA